MLCIYIPVFVQLSVFIQKVGDELEPMKDGKVLTSDVDYVDVWKVSRFLLFESKL